MKALAIHATKNTNGKSDASGAFVPEAVAFQKLYACHREGFDNTLPEAARRAQVEGILARYRELELVAIFCHGYRRGLQTGHTLATVNALADRIAACSAPNVRVVLYACSTAHALNRTRGGFADALRDALTARGKTGHVDGHTTAAHATRNAMLQRFYMGEPESETAGDWFVEPKTPLWSRWRAALRGDLRFRFPTMNVPEVYAALQGAR